MGELFKCNSEKDFIPGLTLNRGFYWEVVRPLLKKNFPELNYVAALMGHCSDVLGYDDYQSTDHVWGPRLQLFLRKEELNKYKTQLVHFFQYHLPFAYQGFPTNYAGVEGWFPTAYMEYKEEYPINHFIEIESIEDFVRRDLEIRDIYNLEVEEWLAAPVQHLLEVTSGEVFEDTIGDLKLFRDNIRFFPREVLLLRLYFLWRGIQEEQAFIGRCRFLGDPIGESLVLHRIINKIMKLCFYYEETYYPYSKWFGVAFKKLRIGSELSELIENCIRSTNQLEREQILIAIFEILIQKHNELEITEEVPFHVTEYYGRGSVGFDAEVITKKLETQIDFTKIKNLELLSKIELSEESNFGCSYEINREIVSTSYQV